MFRSNTLAWKYLTAFTLLEVSLVIIIIGILATVGIVSLAPSNANNLALATMQLANDLRYTQMLAMARGEHYQLSINQAGNNYTISNQTGTIIQTTSLNNNLILWPLGGEIDFTTRGVPYYNNTLLTNNLILSLSNQNNHANAQELIITPLTGQIST